MESIAYLELRELHRLAKACRKAQKDYWNKRSINNPAQNQENMRLAKALEAKLDKKVLEIEFSWQNQNSVPTLPTRQQ